MNVTEQASAANDPVQPHLQEARGLVSRGVVIVAGALLPLAAWMAFAPLSSAVVAPAYVKVDLNRRPVQHAEGGIVREVLVRDGQRVKQGEPLLILGDVSVDADKKRLAYRIDCERASLARLDAEQSLAKAIAFPADLVETARGDPRLAEQIAKEHALFEARRDTVVGQVGLLRAQNEKVVAEIAALRAQIAKANDSMAFQRKDLETNRKLLKDGFISPNRITQLEGTVSDYEVKIEERRSELARAQQRSVDIALRIRSLESDYRQQASDQIKVTAAHLYEIEQEHRKSMDASVRQVIAAPAGGEVIDLKYSTPGSVIPPRETIADIVPEDTRLVTEARIRPEDINQVQTGLAADIRFTAFKYRTTRLVHGKVIYISADRLVDRASNEAYYSVLIEADPVSLAAAGELKLQAGMPAEIYIQGETRTPLQYMVEPLTEVLRHAGRER